MDNYRVLSFYVTLRRLHNLLQIAVREIIPFVNEIKLLEKSGEKKKLVTIILHQCMNIHYRDYNDFKHTPTQEVKVQI